MDTRGRSVSSFKQALISWRKITKRYPTLSKDFKSNRFIFRLSLDNSSIDSQLIFSTQLLMSHQYRSLLASVRIFYPIWVDRCMWKPFQSPKVRLQPDAATIGSIIVNHFNKDYLLKYSFVWTERIPSCQKCQIRIIVKEMNVFLKIQICPYPQIICPACYDNRSNRVHSNILNTEKISIINFRS